jgi:hypothetical protein
MEPPTAADALRAELKGLLSELDEEIRTAYPASCFELARRTDVAEVSIVQDVASLVRRALLGDRLALDARATSPGQAADLRDSLAVCARDVRLERERREADLAALQVLSWPQRLGEAFQQLLDEEERSCAHLAEAGAFAREAAAALKAVVADAADGCLCAISEALRLPSADEQQRRRLAAAAHRRIEAAVASWLAWSAEARRRQQRHWAACPAVRIPRLLTEAAAQDRQVAAFLSALRTAMRLRRQQLRLVAVQQRLAAVLASCDVLASLTQSIQMAA